MSVLFTFLSQSISQGQVFEVGKTEIPYMPRASMYQLSIVPDTATTGTVTPTVKAVHSSSFESITRSAVAITIDLSDPETINPIMGIIESLRVTSADCDGTYRVAISGWD
jgi:hypothetical protein